MKLTVRALVVSPVRVKVYTRLGVPFSATLAGLTPKLTVAASSSVMVPIAVVLVNVLLLSVALVGLPNVTVNPSSGSTVVSPLTLTVIVFVVSPGAKLTVPVGKVPPTKSAAVAGLVPLPITSNCAVFVDDVSPERVTVKVNGVKPTFPSF